MSVISTEMLTRSYGKDTSLFTALNNININIDKSETVSIIGKSGSGKSTLMHLLALLDEPTKGRVIVKGKDAKSYSGKKLDTLRNTTFGFVFQQFFLNGNDSVLNNTILPLKIAGTSRKERAAKGMAALEAVGLEGKAKNKAIDLSGGEKQRVVIARAIINTPEIIFADEPTGNLDSITGKKIEDLLFSLNKEQGITLIIVTHDPDLANRCSRQIHLKDGKILEEK